MSRTMETSKTEFMSKIPSEMTCDDEKKHQELTVQLGKAYEEMKKHEQEYLKSNKSLTLYEAFHKAVSEYLRIYRLLGECSDRLGYASRGDKLPPEF